MLSCGGFIDLGNEAPLMSTNTDDLRIRNLRELLIPEQLIEEMPAQGGVAEHVTASRGAIQSVLEKTDDRLIVVVETRTPRPVPR